LAKGSPAMLQSDELQNPSHSAQKDIPTSSLLIIEDDISTSTAIAKVAEKIGFVATATVSVEEASKLLHRKHYDCITLDLILGKSSAVALIRSIAENAPATPVIILTGSPDWMRDVAVSLGKAARLNVVASMIKPINFAELRVLLSGVIRAAKPIQ